MTPALNITGIARVELASRALPDLENEALMIFNAICNTRESLDYLAPPMAQVCNGHTVLFRLVRSRASRSRVCCYHRDIERMFSKESTQ